MDIGKIIAALNSNTRREIIKILKEGPKTVAEVFNEIREPLSVQYRESIYRALEKLVDVGLLEKYYDREKGLCYRLLIRRLELDLVEGVVRKIQ